MTRFRAPNCVIIPLIAGLLLGDGSAALRGGESEDCVASACCRSGQESCCPSETGGLSCDDTPARVLAMGGSLRAVPSGPLGPCPCEARSSSPGTTDESSSWARLLRQGRSMSLAAVVTMTVVELAPPPVESTSTAGADPSHTPTFLRNARLRC